MDTRDLITSKGWKRLVSGGFCLLSTFFAQANEVPHLPPVPVSMIALPAGSYQPLYKNEGEARKIAVGAFRMDQTPVTNADFLAFVKEHPRWRRSQIKRLLADQGYLKSWQGDLDFGSLLAQAPVTYVSWFAAMAYCQAQEKRLPSLDEWEYAASAGKDLPNGYDDPAYRQQLLDWYSRPNPHQWPAVGSGWLNYWGLSDLHGLIWEWVSDFNTALVSGDARQDSGLDRDLFCGGGSLRASDFQDYAAFMRYGLRSSLKAPYTVANLGFRCTQDLP